MKEAGKDPNECLLYVFKIVTLWLATTTTTLLHLCLF